MDHKTQKKIDTFKDGQREVGVYTEAKHLLEKKSSGEQETRKKVEELLKWRKLKEEN